MDELLKSWSQQLQPWAWNMCVVGSALVIGFILKLVITAVLHFYKNKKDYSLFKSIISHLGPPLNFFIPLLMLGFMMPLMEMNKLWYNTFYRLTGIAIVIAFANLLICTFKIFEDYVYHQYDISAEDNLKGRKVRTQMIFVRKVVIILIVVVTISIILLSFNSVRKLGAGLLTGVGVGGIIIGFAAQKSLGNFLAGMQIAFTQPIRIDDVLVVEGEWGRVEDITLTYVVLAIWDQRRLILPITYFIEKPFQNWTRTTSQILGTVFLYVDYTFPVDELREELNRLLKTNKLWDKRVGVLQVTDSKEHTIELRALMSARNSSHAFDLRCYVRENLLKYITAHMPQSLPQSRYQRNEMEAGNVGNNTNIGGGVSDANKPM
ncbi:MAG TPA: mechanosensitive ion channel domain-containing protein [Mucilaginibacter sp.]|jgi:small-conductance mechanosensitive channel|nr:mechanosensitive ion channel domain-containing protein [Mucilaginibacter sp.]